SGAWRLRGPRPRLLHELRPGWLGGGSLFFLFLFLFLFLLLFGFFLDFFRLFFLVGGGDRLLGFLLVFLFGFFLVARNRLGTRASGRGVGCSCRGRRLLDFLNRRMRVLDAEVDGVDPGSFVGDRRI